MMKIEDYQALAMRTSPEGHDRVLNGCLGLIGESGEIVDVVKKWKFQSGENAELPKNKLIDECGDVLWYCAELCQGLNKRLDRIIDESRRTLIVRFKSQSVCDLVYCLALLCTKPYGKLFCGEELYKDDDFANPWIDCAFNIGSIAIFVNRILTRHCDSSLEEAMERNIEKSKKRYPDGFDPERSLHRPEYENAEKVESEKMEPSSFLFEMRNRTI